MKKIIALVIALCASHMLFAQMKFGIGLHGYIDVPTGTNLAHDLFESNRYDVALLEGVGFGFAASATLIQEDLKGLSIGMELGYAHNEIGWEYKRSTVKMRGKISYSSFDVPLLVGYSFAKGNFRITPHIGPYLSIPIGNLNFDVERIENNGELVSNETISEDWDITSKILFGGMGGVSIGYKVGKGLINFDARYMADLAHLKIHHHGKDGISALTRRKTTFGLSYTLFF
jgi:hypothetical protein